LTLDAAHGKLVLSGTGGYTGGTFVAAGTLVVTRAAAIADNTNLTVGNTAAFVVPIKAASATVAASSAMPVPEPGTLVMLAAGAAISIGVFRSGGGRHDSNAGL